MFLFPKAWQTGILKINSFTDARGKENGNNLKESVRKIDISNLNRLEYGEKVHM